MLENPSLLPRTRSQGWFWLVLAFQFLIIATIPAQSIYTYLLGKTVILQTIPVDPYDWLRGYSQNLRYDISRQDLLQNLPGGEILANLSSEKTTRNQQDIYVILQAPDTTEQTPPKAWVPIAVSRSLPKNLPANQIAIQGVIFGGPWVNYGIESYYFPESQRQGIQKAIQDVTSNDQHSYVVEIKVDPQGNPILISLWIGDKNYKF